MKDDDLIFDLGDASRSDRESVARRFDAFSPEQRAQMKAIKAMLESPEMATRMRLQEAVAARGPLALVLPEKALPKGVMAEVYLNAPAPISRFFAVELSTLDDEVIDRAMSLAKHYEMQHLSDKGAVKFTLFWNGNYVRESATHGPAEERQFFEGFYANRKTKTQHVEREAGNAQVIEVAQVGRVKVISLGSR